MDMPLSEQQLKQNKAKQILKLVSFSVIGIVSVFLIAGSFANSIDRSEIRTAKVSRQDLKTGLSAGGVVVPMFEETIASNIESHLTKVLVQAGEKVITGQTLMQLDTTKVQLQLDNMDEEIALKQNQIKTRKLNLTRTLNDSKGRLELLLVDLDSRKTRFDRMQQLAATGGTSKNDLKEAELNVKRTKIEIRQLEQTIKDNQASSVAEIEGLKLEQSILEKSRREQSRILDSTTVKATRDGLVIWLKNEEGSAVRMGESLVKIADTNAFKLEATISDFYTNQIWQGMPMEFEYNQHFYHGSVQSIIAGDTQGILALTIQLEPSESELHRSLRQKQRVDVSLITEELSDVLVVDKGPFVRGAGIQKVFVINQGNAIRQEVNIGSGNREFYQVKQGLKEGDEIIISDVASIAHLNNLAIN